MDRKRNKESTHNRIHIARVITEQARQCMYSGNYDKLTQCLALKQIIGGMLK